MDDARINLVGYGIVALLALTWAGLFVWTIAGAFLRHALRDVRQILRAQRGFEVIRPRDSRQGS